MQINNKLRFNLSLLVYIGESTRKVNTHRLEYAISAASMHLAAATVKDDFSNNTAGMEAVIRIQHRCQSGGLYVL